MIQYHETLYSSRVIVVALFLPAVLIMCSEALINLTWMKLVTPFLLHKAANIALQGATLRLHHYVEITSLLGHMKNAGASQEGCELWM